MATQIKEQKIGKVRIFLKSGETVKSGRLLHKLFPKNKYSKILDEARKAGIMNAHIYQTHAAYEGGSKVSHYSLEADNRGLTVCLELVDFKEKLESFFVTHKEMLQGKTAIFTEVEFWSYVD